MWLLIPIALTLALIAYQDFRYHAVSWVLFPLAAMLIVIYLSTEFYWKEIAHNFLFNTAFVCLQMLILTGYFSVKENRLTLIVNRYLGMGDILFFFLTGLLLTPVNFILFLICSLFCILLVAIIVKLKYKTTDIPLAGILSVMLIILLIISLITGDMFFYRDITLGKLFLL